MGTLKVSSFFTVVLVVVVFLATVLVVVGFFATVLVVVDFFAKWCAPCRKFFSILESLARQNPDVSFYKIDISKKKGGKLKDKFEVKTIPTLIFFKNDKQLYRVVGRLPEKDLLGVINTYKN